MRAWLVVAISSLLVGCGSAGMIRIEGPTPRVLAPDRCTLDGQGLELTLSSRTDPTWVMRVARTTTSPASLSVLAPGNAAAAASVELLDLRADDEEITRLDARSCRVIRFDLSRSSAVMRVNQGPAQHFFSGAVELGCVDRKGRVIEGTIVLRSCVGSDG